MAIKKYHVSANLFDISSTISGKILNSENGDLIDNSNYLTSDYKLLSAGVYTLSMINEYTGTSTTTNRLAVYDLNKTFIRFIVDVTDVRPSTPIYTFTLATDCYIRISVRVTGTSIMLNTGSTPLPYEPYGNTWQEISYKKYETATDTLTTLPTEIIGDGQSASAVIKGNMSQSGTPTPTNPIYPTECGDKTANLCNEYLIQSSINSSGVVEANGSYNLALAEVKANTVYSALPNWTTGNCVYGFFTQKPTMGSTTYNGERVILIPNQPFSFTSPIDGWVAIWSQIGTNPKQFMLVEGATIPTAYEPYGQYKIPISSANTTTPVYLGEVQSTRQIKQLVLTGEESVILTSNGSFYISNTLYLQTEGITTVCSHYTTIPNRSSVPTIDKTVCLYMDGSRIYIRDTTYTTTTDFQTYLAQQYANGTPVTIWYVLAEPTTDIVNEPLRKIGDYADTVSGITIPTITGKDTFDVETTLNPSEVSLTYTGWHDASVHVYPDSSWMPTSWEEFRKAVRSGKAQSLYPIGTKLYENWGDTTSDAWIVVDYPTGEDYLDSDLAQQGYTNRVMLMEEKLNYLRQFDTIEAWLYVETAIPAGTYRFKIPNHDTSYGGNKWYYFTSDTTVPVGGQLTLTWSYQTNPSSVAAYSSNTSTTALFSVSITEWVEGTSPDAVSLGVIKLASSDPESDYGKLNHIQRARYGSNNYWQSGLRQWLNSSSAGNAWWQPTTIFDRPYANRDVSGYLTTLNSAFKDVLATADITDVANSVFEITGLDDKSFTLDTAYDIKDKIFILSHTEVNLSSSPNVGSVLDYYINAGNTKRIKYRKDNNNAYHWWLRTPYPSVAIHVRGVNTSGALHSSSAYNSLGVAAACIIQ